MKKILFASLFIITIVMLSCSQNGNKTSITPPINSTTTEYTLKIKVENYTQISDINVIASEGITASFEDLKKGIKVKDDVKVKLSLTGTDVDKSNIVWSGEGVSNSINIKETIINMDSDKTIIITISDEEYTLVVSEIGKGNVQVKLNNIIQSVPYIFKKGTQVTLEAIAENNYKLSKYIIDGEEKTDSVITIMIDKDKTVTATFTEKVKNRLSYNVNVNVNDKYKFERIYFNDKKFSVQSDYEDFLDGAIVNLNIIPRMNYKFYKYIINGKDYYDKQMQLVMDSDKVIVPMFVDAKPYTLNIINPYNKLSYSVEVNGSHHSYAGGEETTKITVCEENEIAIKVNSGAGYKLDKYVITQDGKSYTNTINPIKFKVGSTDIYVRLFYK